VELVRLAIDQVGDMEGCRFIALLAFHIFSPTAARTIARPRAPSCNAQYASEGGTSECEQAQANAARGILAVGTLVSRRSGIGGRLVKFLRSKVIDIASQPRGALRRRGTMARFSMPSFDSLRLI
jgi:hypothetical protein